MQIPAVTLVSLPLLTTLLVTDVTQPESLQCFFSSSKRDPYTRSVQIFRLVFNCQFPSAQHMQSSPKRSSTWLGKSQQSQCCTKVAIAPYDLLSRCVLQDDPASPESQQASPFGLATLKKAVNVIAHYVEFSDNSSSWSGSEKDGAETLLDNEDLQTPLLQSESPQAYKAKIVVENTTDPAEVNASSPAATSDKASLVSAEVNILSDPEVQSPHRDADGASSSNDGAQTPTRHDLRTPVMQSQPMDQGTVSPAQSDSPKVAPSGGLENLGSGLLDPSLLVQLLDEHAPPPDMPYAPISHVEPVLAAEQPGKLQLENNHRLFCPDPSAGFMSMPSLLHYFAPFTVATIFFDVTVANWNNQIADQAQASCAASFALT